MTWTLLFQIAFVAVLIMLVAVFILGLYRSVVDTRHKHAVEMEMAKHGHKVEVGAVVVNTGTATEREMAERADAILTQERQGRGL